MIAVLPLQRNGEGSFDNVDGVFIDKLVLCQNAEMHRSVVVIAAHNMSGDTLLGAYHCCYDIYIYILYRHSNTYILYIYIYIYDYNKIQNTFSPTVISL